MSILQQHTDLRKGVYKQIIEVKTLKETENLKEFVDNIPKIPSNLNYRQCTALPHHLKIYMLKSKLKKKHDLIQRNNFQNALCRLNMLRFPRVPR